MRELLPLARSARPKLPAAALQEFRTTALVVASPENGSLSAPFHNVSVVPDAKIQRRNRHIAGDILGHQNLLR